MLYAIVRSSNRERTGSFHPSVPVRARLAFAERGSTNSTSAKSAIIMSRIGLTFGTATCSGGRVADVLQRLRPDEDTCQQSRRRAPGGVAARLHRISRRISDRSWNLCAAGVLGHDRNPAVMIAKRGARRPLDNGCALQGRDPDGRGSSISAMACTQPTSYLSL